MGKGSGLGELASGEMNLEHRARKRHWRVASLNVLTVLALLFATLGHARGATVPVGHAAVIAQGIAKLPANAMAWRVALRPPDPAQEHPPIARHLGFTLPRKGQLLVTGYERKDDVTLLGPGQAAFAREGEDLGRDQVGSEPTDYWTIELVDAKQVKETEGDALVLGGPTFTPPAGRRNLQLVRDVVDEDERSDLGKVTATAVVLATNGSVLVAAEGKTTTLREGKAGTFTGVVTVTGGSGGAAFVAATIGKALDSLGPQPAATTAAPTVAPQPTAVPQPTETPADGMISLVTYLCPAGVSVVEAAPETCGGNSGLGSGRWSLTGAAIDGEVEALIAHGIWVWRDLPRGEYAVHLDEMPDGYASFVIDLNGNAAREGTRITVTLGNNAPETSINVYFLAAGDQTSVGTATLGLIFYDCPAGTTADEFVEVPGPRPDCSERADPLDVSLDGDALAQSLTTSDLQEVSPYPSLDGRWQWTGIPAGTYTLIPFPIDPGDTFYFHRTCGDQSCSEIEGSGDSISFDLPDGVTVLLVYRLPAGG
ncbi:MAG: hypothetical protein QOJ59_3071 [Thermomicrobiales bacterium]|nr:hypothetical protein [Thermomicrobiales bacterium]